MNVFIAILSQFVDGRLSPEEFATQFIKARNDLVNEQYALINSDEEARTLLDQLSVQLKEGKLTNIEYADQMTSIVKQLGGFKIHPFSKTAEIIDHMMGEADAYVGDPPPTSTNIRTTAQRGFYSSTGIDIYQR